MKFKIKNAIIFFAGLVGGAAGTFAYMKAKWQKDFDAKREEMIQYYEEKTKKLTDNADVEKKMEQTPEKTLRADALNQAKVIIKNYDYSKKSESIEKTKNLSPSINDDYREEPYAIDSREYGTNEMYEMLTFRLHDDGDIVNEKYEPLDPDSIENYIGTAILKNIADLRDLDPELDSYYIRNDRLKMDIEILIEPKE